MSWKPHGDPRQIGPGVVQYLRGGHTHEGAYQVDVDGHVLIVAPDGHTTARRRLDMISRGLDSGWSGEAALVRLVGTLILAGVTNLELDGLPVLAASGSRGEWRVMLSDDGRMEATFIGAGAG